MGGLLQTRLDSLDARRLEALITVGVLVLLVLIAFVMVLGASRRGTPAGGEHIDRGMPVNPERPDDGYGTGPLDQMPNYGEVNPTRRERSGALR
jgi:hypothetical protein